VRECDSIPPSFRARVGDIVGYLFLADQVLVRSCPVLYFDYTLVVCVNRKHPRGALTSFN